MKQNWTYKKLGEVCEVLDSKRKPVTKADRVSGVYPYYGATGIQDYVDKYIFDGDYLLVGEDGAKWGTNDKTAYQIHGKCWVNNHAHVLRINDDIAKASFIEHYLVWKDLSSFITGAIVQKLTQAALISIPIPIPPLETQSRIVSELDLLQSIVDKQKAQLKELDNLAQAVFYDMFGDPVENDKGWEVSHYGAEFEIGAGGTPSTKVAEYWNDGTIPWIGSNMCQNRVIYETDGKFITEEGLKHSSAKMLEPNTVLVALVGATIGKVALLKTQTTTNQNIAFIKQSHKFSPTFVFYHMMSLYDEFMKLGNGDFKMANQGFIKMLTIILPPLSLQQSFAAKIESIEKQKAAISKSIAETEKLFEYTMDKYFG